MAEKKKPNLEPTVENRKARRDYAVLDTLETCVVLRGTEIKSVRESHVSLGEAFVEVSKRGELWLVNARIDENGKIVTHGDQLLLGGNDRYTAMCHQCWKRRIREQEG